MRDIYVTCNPLLPAEAVSGPLQGGVLFGSAPHTNTLTALPYPDDHDDQGEQDSEDKCGRGSTRIGQYIRHATSPFSDALDALKSTIKYFIAHVKLSSFHFQVDPRRHVITLSPPVTNSLRS